MIDGLAQPIEHLLEAVVIGVILRRHFKIDRGGDGHGDDHIVLAARRFREVLQEVIELRRQAALAIAADVVHQLVDEDQAGPIGWEELADHIAGGRFLACLMFGHMCKGFGAAQLKGDLAPRRLAQRRAIFAAAPPDRVELCADKDGDAGLRHALDAGPVENLVDARPAIGARPVPGEVIEQRQRVRLAAAERRGHVEHRRGLGLFARQAAHDFGGEAGEVLREVGAIEEAIGLLIIGGRAAIAHLIEMHRELGCVERLAFTQVFAGGDDPIPRFESHVLLR